MWEKDIDIHEVKELRVKTTAYLGVGAIQKIDTICKRLKNMGIDSILCITGKQSYITSGAWQPTKEALEKYEIRYEIYDKITPNPETWHVNEAAELGKVSGAQAVIGIGGGSPIDTAKSVAILLKYSNQTAEELFEFKFSAKDAVPIVAINLTHGTGTEVDRFAVVSIPSKEYKPSIAYECIYPMYAIDDPALMTSLPQNQSTYVSVDALNHILEACTTKTANPLSILLAQEAVRLIANYLPKVRADGNDLEARYYLAYASLIAGTAFDNGLLHLTHAMEHTLSAVKPELTHGLGLAVLLPSVIKHIFDAKRHTLLTVLEPILDGMREDEATAELVSSKVKTWLVSVGIDTNLQSVGFNNDDVEKLTKLAYETPGQKGLFNCAPVKVTPEIVSAIYRDSL